MQARTPGAKQELWVPNKNLEFLFVPGRTPGKGLRTRQTRAIGSGVTMWQVNEDSRTEG
jgi:hypothetical protein